MAGANLFRAQLLGADLRGAQLVANLIEMRRKRANLREARLDGSDLAAAQVELAKRLEPSLAELADLSLVDASWLAQLEGVDFLGAQLAGANLYRAHLKASGLMVVQLVVNLGQAQLERANLRGAQLAGAILVQTNLSAAKLAEAQMEGADLRGANLKFVEAWNLTWAQLQTARNVEYAELPAHLIDERARQARPDATAPTEQPMRGDADSEQGSAD